MCAQLIINELLYSLVGGVVVRNYAPKIFNSAGFGYRQSLLFNLALGGMKVGTTAMAIFFVDSLGRKPLLLGGIMLTSSGMLMLTLSFAAGLERNIGLYHEFVISHELSIIWLLRVYARI